MIDEINYNSICPGDIDTIDDYSEYVNNNNWNILCNSNMILQEPFNKTIDGVTYLCESQKEGGVNKFLCPTLNEQNINRSKTFCQE